MRTPALKTKFSIGEAAIHYSRLLIHRSVNYDVGMPQRAVWLTLLGVGFCIIAMLALVAAYAPDRLDYIDLPW